MKTAFVAIVAAALFPLGAAAQGTRMGTDVRAGAGVDAGATVGQESASAGSNANANAGARGSGSDTASGSARGGLGAQGSLGRDGPDTGTQAQGSTSGRSGTDLNNQTRPRSKTPEELSASGSASVPAAPDAASDRAGTTRN